MINNKFLSPPLQIKSFGNSMYPLLQDGDIVYIKRADFNKLKINDIVCIRKNNHVFTHRVIYKKGNYIITKGDTNPLSDGKIYTKHLIGKVDKIKRGKDILDLEDFYLIQSSFYFNEIVKVKKAFEKEKIDFLFLKGLPLHLYYEGSHPRRIYADCDVLIERGIFTKAALILKKMGYSVADMAISKSQKKLKDKESEVSFYKIKKNILITFDIHLEVVFLMTQLGRLEQLYSQKQLDSLSRKMLKDKRIIKLNNVDFPILTGSNLLVYLILHLYHHNFKGSYRYDLIKTVLKKEKINYVDVAEVVNKYKLNNFIFPSIILIYKYYSVEFPDTFPDSIKPKNRIMPLINTIKTKTKIFDDEERVSAGVERFKNIFFLSPNRLSKKMGVFFNIQVLNAIFWVVLKRGIFKRY